MKPITGNRAAAIGFQAAEPIDQLEPIECADSKTYGEVSDWQLAALGRALGLQAETQGHLDLQRFLFHPWRDCRIPDRPVYPSLIGDDHSPYEYSLAFGRSGVELRILFEAQAEAPSASGNQLAAELVNEQLRCRFGVDFSRLDVVRDLFLPASPQPPFSLWHAVCLNTGRKPEFKIYLNPAAHGRENTWKVVSEALRRLGFGRSTQRLLENIGRRGKALDEIRYFSLDLSSEAHARVKVYFAHWNANVKQLETAFSFAPTHKRGDIEQFCDTVVGSRGPFTRKPVTSCFSFVAGNNKPSAATLHVPIAHYLNNDEIVARRVHTYLDMHGLAAQTYARALRGLSRRQLNCGAGIHSYASYRREKDGPRCTVYLSPELFTSHEERSSTRMKVADF